MSMFIIKGATLIAANQDLKPFAMLQLYEDTSSALQKQILSGKILLLLMLRDTNPIDCSAHILRHIANRCKVTYRW